MPFPKADPSIIETLSQYDSATVQNAAILVRGYVPESQDYTGPEMRQLTSEQKTVVGYAMTSTWMPLHEPLRSTADRDDFYGSIADAGAPVIVVLQDIDIPPRRGAIIGDGMAYTMRAMGAVGAVTDGNARDVPGIEKAGLHLWATGRVPGHGPFNLVTCGEPVTAAGLRILQGDILVCDADGVTRVPVDIAADVAKKCAEVREKESKMHRYFTAKDFSVERWRRERGR